MNAAVQGDTASFADPGTITANTLIRFSGSEQGALTGNWWTTVENVVRSDGTAVLSPEEIQSVLGLTYTPTYAAIGGEFPPGSSVYVGEVAPVVNTANGGALQVFSTDAAEGTESFNIGAALQDL